MEPGHFILRTDRRSLQSLLTSSNASEQLTTRRLWILKRYFEIVYRAGFKYRAPNALSTLKREWTYIANIFEELPVAMINKTGEREDVGKEYFDQNESNNKQDGSQMDSQGEETGPPNLTRLLKAQENYSACAQVALTSGLTKSVFTFDTEGALASI